ncbi:MAG: pyridoxamine 5'-phosphate oxidase family protein [Pseudomonadota bacterium]
MEPREPTHPQSPWHEGEKAIQRSVGVDERMESVGKRVVRDYLLDQHREFYPLLPFVVLGAVDKEGRPWATLRAGQPGFLNSPDTKTLHLSFPRDFSDPAESGMEAGDSIGLLGIDPRNRRRNRLNGAIKQRTEDGFDIAVAQSYGNCPQYIQLRAPEFTRDPVVPSTAAVVTMETLDVRARAIIEQADTFFVASYVDHETSGRQVDVSHRGGKTGFVRVGDDGVLTIPDFPGNLFFNTLGNFQLNPRAGLVFTDFTNGDLLQMTGTVEILLDSPEIATFQGAERLWRFTPQLIIYRPASLPLKLEFQADGWSPNSLMTGSWEEADRRAKVLALASAWRPFRISRLVDESSLVRSLILEPVDGLGLTPQQPGQHLPIRITLPDSNKAILRTYTLSSAPSDDAYRLSVKKEGAVSRYLHSLAVGDVIEARAPAGNFTISAIERKPVVMLAAGIGITPMIAMLKYLLYEGFRLRRTRPTWLFYSARTKAERAFDVEIEKLVAASNGAVQVIRLLSNTEGAVEDKDYDIAGRFDVQMLREILPFDDYEFFICGPAGFMQASYDGLRKLNIDDERIHAEAFGPASLTRTARANSELPTGPLPSTEPVAVAFVSSGKEARWTPGTVSLLELAESRGIDAPFSCRAGTCGSCATRVIEGAVAYTKLPSFKVPADQALICCSVPAASDTPLRLHLDL